ncbi:MAG TPA: helix-turn-helix transcriptional regulator [Gemmataceae bacterium]|nr:helix-turn-helix transcriptional regulator [Gemmataceae bacterium]
MAKALKKPTRDAVEILHERYFEGNPAMLELLEEERQQAEIAQQIHDLRTAAGLTQRELAARVGTTASVICRLEDANYDRYSLVMLRRIAAALESRVLVRFLPPGEKAKGAKKTSRKMEQSQ